MTANGVSAPSDTSLTHLPDVSMAHPAGHPMMCLNHQTHPLTHLADMVPPPRTRPYTETCLCNSTCPDMSTDSDVPSGPTNRGLPPWDTSGGFAASPMHVPCPLTLDADMMAPRPSETTSIPPSHGPLTRRMSSQPPCAPCMLEDVPTPLSTPPVPWRSAR